MASTTHPLCSGPLPPSEIVRLIAAGAADLRATGFRGAAYGALFALMGYVIARVYEQVWQMTMGLTAAFFLIGPFICCGIYELSRQRERGEPVDLRASLTCWRRNWKSVAFFAATLTFFMIVWARVSVVLFALFATHTYPELTDMIRNIVSMNNLAFLVVWTAVGCVFAALVFAISVVSMPLMLDRDADTMEAIGTSAVTLWNNPGAMLVWALSITLLIGASLVFFLPLLALTAPLVGHATWKVYRALVPVDMPLAFAADEGSTAGNGAS
jgi:uncharacterized membrane protein